MKGASGLSIKSSRRDKKEIHGKGTVKYLSFEGGFHGIVGDDGKHYDPLNLPQEFRVDGLQVRFTAIATDHMVSFHTWGYIVKLTSIERLP
jgi:inhibitor of cysteine peptidase